MKTTKKAIAALALGATLVAQAQELEVGDAEELGADGAGLQEAAPVPAKTFYTLPKCYRFEGVAEVLRPTMTAWEKVEDGRHYPLGSSFRAVGEASGLTLELGVGCCVELSGGASVGTRPQTLGIDKRTIVLHGGTVDVKLPRNMPSGALTVAAPGFSAKDLAGESRFVFEDTGDGDLATIRCVTGKMALEGRHFAIPELGAADEIRVRTSQDVLMTGLYGVSGDCKVKLDQGIIAVRDVVSGEVHNETPELVWNLTPHTAVRIHRAVPAIGERMSVTVITFDSAGCVVNRCAFAEGRPEVNSGEIGDGALASNEEGAKKAMKSANSVTTEEVSVENVPVEASSDFASDGDGTTEESTIEE